MYNDSVIQEQSGLNAFYNKIYSLVGIGVGISALVSGLMMTVFLNCTPKVRQKNLTFGVLLL